MINSKIKTSQQRFEKVVPVTIILVAALIILYFFLRPVKIVSTVREWNEGYFFVDNFPMTAKARIAWWQDNKELLKEKYNMPFIGSDKRWMVLIGEAGDGFQFLQHRASDNDLRCFDSLKPGANCVEKNGCYGYRTTTKPIPVTRRMIVNIFSVARMLKLSVLLINR
ncbi:hypothetical protein ERHA54_18870 [Erwinia rhapontici]|uniref:DUF943 family protein n=1 Tax=Erwinia rhapontici TaxID=55212 RepID=UPI001BB39820|nr:DUF943 family protein [Erwinia rhapontici]BCQ39284.1 hypothetical protein ERHA54_18870 [Erwinia rhapontici]